MPARFVFFICSQYEQVIVICLIRVCNHAFCSHCLFAYFYPCLRTVRESKSESVRGGHGGGRGYGRGRGSGGGYYRDSANNENSYGNREISASHGAPDEADAGKTSERRGGGYGGPRGPYRGGRRGGYGNGEAGEGDYPRRPLDRHSRTGRGYVITLFLLFCIYIYIYLLLLVGFDRILHSLHLCTGMGLNGKELAGETGELRQMNWLSECLLVAEGHFSFNYCDGILSICLICTNGYLTVAG